MIHRPVIAVPAVPATLAAAGCERSPTYPSDLGPDDNPYVISMWIESEHLTNSALLEMRVSDEVQLTACVDHRDDEDLRTVDCTIGASWSSSNARAVTVDDGLVRAVAAGSASVGAEYQGARASLLARSSLGPDVPVWWLVGAVSGCGSTSGRMATGARPRSRVGNRRSEGWEVAYRAPDYNAARNVRLAPLAARGRRGLAMTLRFQPDGAGRVFTRAPDGTRSRVQLQEHAPPAEQLPCRGRGRTLPHAH